MPLSPTCLFSWGCHYWSPICANNHCCYFTVHILKIDILPNKWTSWCNTHDVHKLLHVSAPRYHPLGVTRAKVYKPTCQYMFCVLHQEVHLFDTILRINIDSLLALTVTACEHLKFRSTWPPNSLENADLFVCLFVFGATAPSGPGPTHSRGF